MFQWFQPLVNYLLKSLDALYQITVQMGVPSYALAIVLLTVVVNIILYPLKHYQMKSLKKIQDLQPKVKELDAKYKSDPQKKQQELMELYKQHGANPLTGCLPLIIQMPIFIALYTALQQLMKPNGIIHLNPEHVSFFWISNIATTVSKADPFFLLPILVGVTTYYSQKISMANNSDPTQQTMLIAMPLLFGFMTINFPVGLAIYWITFSVVGIIQQLIINKTTKSIIPVTVIESVPEKEDVKNNDDRKNRKNRS